MAATLRIAPAVPASRCAKISSRSGLPIRYHALVARAVEKDKYPSSPSSTNVSGTASTSEDAASEFDSEKLMKDLKEQWDSVEDKTSIAVYAAGALTILWLSSTLVPKFMELVGLGYTAWFVYRYLLFKDSRKELISDVEELKKKISGDEGVSR